MGALHIMNFVILVFLGVMYVFMPKIINKYLLFGVTVTDEILDMDDVRAAKKQYTSSMIFTTIFIALIYVVWVVMFESTAIWGFVGLLLLEMAVMSLFYLRAHRQVKEVKGTPVQSTKIISTVIGASSEVKVLPWYVFLLNIGITIGVAIYSLSMYDSLPDVLAIHFDANGVADGFADKSYFYVLLMPVTMLLMTGLLMFVNYSFKVAKKVSGSSRRKLSLEQEIRSRFYWSLSMYVFSLIIIVLFAVIQLFTLGIFTQNEMMMWINIGAILAIIGIVIALVLITGQSGARIKQEKEDTDIEDSDDDEYWKLGVFYVNKEDPTLFVNKRFGVGMTLNFANPWSWLFIAVIVVIVVGSVLLPFILS